MRGDVLTHASGRYVEALLNQLRQQLVMQKVNLSQVRLRGVRPHPGAVLHRRPGVRITGYP